MEKDCCFPFVCMWVSQSKCIAPLSQFVEERHRCLSLRIYTRTPELKRVIGTMKTAIAAVSFKSLGILAVPVVIMMPCGLLGLKRGQIAWNRLVFVLVNFLCLLRCVLVLGITGAVFVNKSDLSTTADKFTIGVCVSVALSCSMLIWKCYKEYNIVSLLIDVKNLKLHSLCNTSKLYLCILFSVVASSVVYKFQHITRVVVKEIESGHRTPWTVSTSDPTLIIVFAVVELVIFYNTVWMSMLGVSFLLGVISIVLKREFTTCVLSLEEAVEKEKTLSDKIFTETSQRYVELISVVHKVNKMFSDLVALILAVSLGILCTGVYSIMLGDTFTGWMPAIIMSLSTTAVLLPPLTMLNMGVGHRPAIKYFLNK